MLENIDFPTFSDNSCSCFQYNKQKRSGELEGQLRFLINEVEVLCDIVESLPAEEELEEYLICDTSETNPSKPRQKRRTFEEALEGKPFTKRYVDVQEDKKVRPECGTPYKRIGEEYLRTEYVEKQNSEKGTRFDKAVTYIRNRRDLLENYLLDGRCSFSNNASERAVKQVVIGRKNWLFAVGPSGAEVSALIYIMVEMARANGMNVYQYLTYLLEKCPTSQTSTFAELSNIMSLALSRRECQYFIGGGTTWPILTLCFKISARTLL